MNSYRSEPKFLSNLNLGDKSKFGDLPVHKSSLKAIEGESGAIRDLCDLFGLIEVPFAQMVKPKLWEVYTISDSQLQSFERLAGSSIGLHEASNQNDLFRLKYYYDNLRQISRNTLVLAKPAIKKSDHTNQNHISVLERGLQFSLNHPHSSDFNSILHHGFFKQNGMCGYVPKPINSTHTLRLELEILSGHQIREVKEESSSILVELVVTQPSSSRSSDEELVFVTQVVRNNHFNPHFFKNCVFQVKEPEISFLTFQVINTISHSLLGWYSLPVSCVRQGYRAVPLKDEYLRTIENSYLLVNVKLTQAPEN